jgi:hypothetical protein
MERARQKRIAKKLALVLIACLSVTICLVGPAACSRQCTATSEDYGVYSAILLEVEKVTRSYGKAELIIFEETSSHEDYSPPIWDLRPPIKQASDETVARFMSRQKCRWHLKPRFDGATSYRIVSTKDLVSTLGKGDWDEFHKENPKSFGIWHLSPVGYNTKGTEALVYVAHNCGGLCGSGGLFVLAKENGRWVVKNQVRLWIS